MQELLHEEEARTAHKFTTPEQKPRPLGAFTLLSPSKRRCTGNHRHAEKDHTRVDDDLQDEVQNGEDDFDYLHDSEIEL